MDASLKKHKEQQEEMRKESERLEREEHVEMVFKQQED